MVGYRLSERADEDFESIFIYGFLTFGLQQAEAYAAGMQARFEQLTNQPLWYPAIDHIRSGYRFSVYGSHTIYFRIDDDEILIVRILRNQDVSSALSQECDS